LLHAASRSQRAIVTRITALGTSTGVAAFLAVEVVLASEATLELAVNAALVVLVVEVGALAGRSARPHAIPVAAAASASTRVVPRIRCMMMSLR
jgi:hypothetical protein